MANYYAPAEIIEYTVNAAIQKSKRPLGSFIILGFLSGCSIGLGAITYIISSAPLMSANPAVAKFIGASLFSTGLMLTLVLGMELFTSNCLLMMSVFHKRVKFLTVLKLLCIIYIANFLGSFFIGAMTLMNETLNADALRYLHKIAEHKVHSSWLVIFTGGILCNILVCGAVLMAYAAHDIIGKIFVMWFPITAFVLLGYDHCVANMFYLPTAMLSGSSISISEALYNLFFATIGNFIGGGIFMSFLLCTVFKAKE